MLIHSAARAAYTATSRRTNRTRIGAARSVTRLRAVLANLASRVNGDRVTAAAYLTSIGADDDTIRRYASQVGKHATRIQRDSGAEPARNGLAVVGHRRLVAVNTYPAAVLAEATKAYARTSHLIGA
jgi:hypothetical protein